MKGKKPHLLAVIYVVMNTVTDRNDRSGLLDSDFKSDN